MSIRQLLRWMLMPGLDLFTRRRVRLCRHWGRGPRRVLDAGSGNGWFSYLASRSGASVTAVNFAEDQVEKARAFYNDWRGIPQHRLSFRTMNLYDVGCLRPGFAEIICYETLEHIRGDAKVCQSFWDLLAPGGFLHLCCPYADHPRWRDEPLDLEEKGYHVRAGYTLESYRALLEPIGFQIVGSEGMGGPVLFTLSRWVDAMRAKVGDAGSLPLALASMPFVALDARQHRCPYALYVKALKPATST